MKKIVSETIDGSIKDIIQLKTLDASLEYSQLFDALEECPREFQSKLVGALNSLGETMQIPPTEVFNKVLCKSDEDEDVKKKLYNWWRAVFEVLSQCDIPDDRVEEYNQKVDDLMAEILKAGDGEATAEEEPEDMFAEEYEPASMKDEAKMLENMDFAIQELGEVATKVQDLVNFVNPYCGTEVNESGDQPKFKVGDVVKVMGVSGMDFYGRDAPIGPIVKIQPPHPDVGVYEYLIKGRSGEFFAYEDELELFPERFTEEENSKMKKITKERGGFGLEPDYDDLPDDWGSWNNYDGDEDDEGYDADSDDYELSDDERRESWRGRHPYLERGAEDDGGPWLSEKEIIGMKVSGESSLKNELDKGDDGWTTIGQPVSEAKVVVEVNDVWDVLELLDNDIANKELTDLINSHVRTEEEIMDAIDELCGETISKKELNTLLSGRMATLVDYLGLDVEQYESNGEFVEEGKPTSVELESVEAGETKKVTLSVDWDDDGAGLDSNVVVDVPAEIADSEETDALYDYISDWIDQQDFAVNDWMITDIEGLMDEGSKGEIKDGNKQLVQEAWKDVLGLAAGAVMGGLTMGPLGILIGAWSGHGVQEFFHKRNALKNITDSQLFVLASLKALGKNGASMKNFIQTSGGKIKEEDVQELIRIDAITVQLIGDNITLSEEGQEILDKAGYDEKAFQAAAKEEAEDKAEEERIAAEETGDGQKPEEVKSQDKTFNQDGENKTLVAGEENQKPVCEMTIEQEVPSPQSLSRLLWEQGKEHLMELLTSEYVDNDAILPTIEDMGLRNLTEINDAFAYDFETILDSLGCDPDAWAERLEIVKKGGEEPVDEAKKKIAGDPEAQKIEDAIPVDDKDGFLKIEKDERYGAGAQVAYFAPGSQAEINHAASELRKALPEYQIYTSDNQILLLPKKNRK